jgi:GntR family transcriptional regulator, arabinose operon transcriptional repressor
MTTQKKYEALRQELIDYIKKNKLGPNDQLPTVRDILKNTEYSYATLNRTLLEMEREGLITKRQGKGLYVDRVLSDDKPNKEISLIIPKDFTQHRIFLDILAGVRTAAEKLNFGLLVSISNMSHEKEKETIDKLIHQRIDGMIIFLEDNYRQDYSHIVSLQQRKFPFVLIDRFIPDLATDYVVINNWDAMHKVCAYLRYKRECDTIVFIPSNDTSVAASSSDEKTLGYKDAVKMLFGNSNQVITLDDFVAQIGEMCRTHKNVGVCLNHDTMIPDMHRKFKESGKTIPVNCHIFGYNNSYDPPLYPTVEQFNDQVGLKAAEILMEKIKDPARPPVQIRINPKLVIPDENGKYHLED